MATRTSPLLLDNDRYLVGGREPVANRRFKLNLINSLGSMLHAVLMPLRLGVSTYKYSIIIELCLMSIVYHRALPVVIYWHLYLTASF